MIERGSLWLPLAILLLLAGLSFWIERAIQLAPESPGSAQSDPEGIMENFNALRTNLEGRQQYRLTAQRLKHYSDSKLTEMEMPRFTHFDTSQGDVTASSRQATVSPDGEEIDLTDDVVVVRSANTGTDSMILRTARLLVFPERNLLRAPGSVDVSDRTLSVRAGAMEYQTDLRIVKLTGRVKARYSSKAP